MTILSAKLTFHVLNAHSLKDKRMTARSLIDKVRHKFNVSIAEVDSQDAHQTLTLGLAVVSGEPSHARDMLNTIIRYMEAHTDAELVSVEMAK